MTEQNSSVHRRADAIANQAILLDAAKEIFAERGVDAPMRAIAQQAGVGVGTIYRHFPTRGELIAAVFQREIEVCAANAHSHMETKRPDAALHAWLLDYLALIGTKRGLAQALYASDPANDGLRTYFRTQLSHSIDALMRNAQETKLIRTDINLDDILHAVGSLAATVESGGMDRACRIVSLLVDGMRLHPKEK